MILTYDAVDSTGQSLTNTVEAADINEAVEQLRARGLFVKNITEQRRAGVVADATKSIAKHGRLPLSTLAVATRQMAMLLRAGSGIVPGLTAIKRQMKKPHHAALFEQVTTDLEGGATLTDALRRHPRTFDAVYCAVIAAGEASGKMAEMFERLALMIGKRRAMRNTILGALAYPALLIMMCISIINGLLFFVLPRFNDMFVQLDVETPAATRAMLALGDVMRTYWPVGLPALVAIGGLVTWLLVGARGRQWLANVQTAIPIVGRLRSRLIQGQLFRTMGMLLENRVSVLDSLALVRESTSNRRFQTLFSNMEDAVVSGGQLSSAFEESGMIEPYICQAIRTGEDSGNLGGAMSYCADVLDETNAELVKVVSKMIEPTILIRMGVVVGVVAISLFLPLFDMTSAMK